MVGVEVGVSGRGGFVARVRSWGSRPLGATAIPVEITISRAVPVPAQTSMSIPEEIPRRPKIPGVLVSPSVPVSISSVAVPATIVASIFISRGAHPPSFPSGLEMMPIRHDEGILGDECHICGEVGVKTREGMGGGVAASGRYVARGYMLTSR